VLEYTELFKRGVGETTDVVNKEMYTFEDKGGRSVTLKPEGTAGAARLFIENGLASSPMPVKTYYITPAFRYERPQAGRLREFHQFGIEIFGSKAYETDAEVIFAASSFLDKLGVKSRLEINSIGCKTCRAEYNRALKNYFAPHLNDMCAACRSRYDKNPLRMLDCKEDCCKKFTNDAPAITDYLCEECALHFDGVKKLLNEQGLNYTVNPRIVRGLDYYGKTVFEFVSDAIGAQGTVCGGGRYDGLIEELGGVPMPAIGFAAGIERLLILMENTEAAFPDEDKPLIYIAGLDENSRAAAFKAVTELRLKGIRAELDHMSRSVKAQFKYADKLGVKYVAAIGGNELSSGEVNIKNMADGSQEKVKLKDIYTYLKAKEKI
ncbi:MAG: histidine--tRNA ligase, partial [Clostridia bacterium]|nr:histidine--tRNA ligase [Clostridia bacterium]